MNETNKKHSERVEKFVRGSIWWCRDDGLKVCEPGKQHGTRPALIVSNDERGSSPSVEVLKITSADKEDRCPGINIPLFMNGKQCYVLCNQHFTVATSSLEDFIGICPEKTMTEVEKGMLRAIGMTQLIHMQSKYYDLTRTVQEVVDERLSKYRALPQDNNDNVVDVISGVIRGLNVMLNNAEESLKSQIVSEAKATGETVQVDKVSEEIPDTTTNKISDEVEDTVTETLTKSVNNKTRKGFRKNITTNKTDTGIEESVFTNNLGEVGSKRATSTTIWTVEEIDGIKFERSSAGKISWNLEAAKLFVHDCDTLPLAKVCERWGYTDRKKCSSMKYVIRNKFNL